MRPEGTRNFQGHSPRCTTWRLLPAKTFLQPSGLATHVVSLGSYTDRTPIPTALFSVTFILLLHNPRIFKLSMPPLLHRQFDHIHKLQQNAFRL